MDLTPEQLATIEEMAALQFSTAEVAIIAEVPENAMAADPGATSFLRGRLKAQAEVRESVREMARQGAAPAQKQFLDLAAKSEPDIDKGA